MGENFLRIFLENFLPVTTENFLRENFLSTREPISDGLSVDVMMMMMMTMMMMMMMMMMMGLVRTSSHRRARVISIDDGESPS